MEKEIEVNVESGADELEVTGPFDVYNDMKRKLIAKGIPAREIAFVHDGKDDKGRERIFEAFRRGDIKILLGSTQKMGIGVNVQARVAALHHLDPTWTPDGIMQRDGRGVRQGNTNKEISVYRYVTKGSFDIYYWQLLENKAGFISQIMRGDSSVREVEDCFTLLNPAEVKALAQGRPEALRFVHVQQELAKLESLKRSHVSERVRMVSEISMNTKHIEMHRDNAAGYAEAIKIRDRNKTEKFSCAVKGAVIDNREKAGKNILMAVDALPYYKPTTIGRYAGFDFTGEIQPAGYEGVNRKIRLVLPRGILLESGGLSYKGITQSFDNELRNMENHVEACREAVARLEAKNAGLEKIKESQFSKQDELVKLKQEEAALRVILEKDKIENEVREVDAAA